MLIVDYPDKIDSAKAEIYSSILAKIFSTCKKFSFKQLNETIMNYRNILLQNLFKIYGKFREVKGMENCKCCVIEFYNSELDDQENIDNFAFEKTLNLKSLLNMGVCLNGWLIRVYDKKRLGYRHKLVYEILHL
jgi:hypothetical protein